MAARMIQSASTLRVRVVALRLAWVPFALLAIGISGCGNEGAKEHSEVNSPKPAGTTSEPPKHQESPPSGSTGVTQGAFPAMPTDVPLYPGAKHTMGNRVGTQTVGSWKTADTSDAVVVFYTEQLPESGWTIDKKEGSALGATMEASKDGRKLMVAITRALPEGAVANLSHRP